MAMDINLVGVIGMWQQSNKDTVSIKLDNIIEQRHAAMVKAV